jgi:hypothetical protein
MSVALVLLVVLTAGLLKSGLMLQRSHGANLARAKDFSLPGIAEAVAEKEGISLAEAQRLEHEFRRWFVVAAASRVPVGMESKAVDAFWHALLEQPALYESFSRAVAGRVIVHLAGVRGDVLNARAWVGYEQIWHEPPPADLWPIPSDASIRRVRVSIRRSESRTAGGDGGSDFTVYADMSGASSGHDFHHQAGHADGDGHSHGADGGSHGHGCGGHGCGGGH